MNNNSDHRYSLREARAKKYNNSESDFEEFKDNSDEEFQCNGRGTGRSSHKNGKKKRRQSDSDNEENIIELDRLPKNLSKLKKMDEKITQKINYFTLQYFKEQEENL